MSASYPTSAKTFTAKTDFVDDVLAADVNAMQDEITAIETDLLVKIAKGTAFPGGPVAGQRFFRTDLGWECYYDGSRWLTVNEFSIPVSVFTLSANGNSEVLKVRGDYAPYFTRVEIVTNVAATNDGSHYWTITLTGMSLSGGATTTIYTFNTGADSSGTYVDHSGAASTPVPTNKTYVYIAGTKSSTPGNLSYCYCAIFYRLIVT